MNNFSHLIKNHRSIRQFTNQKIPESIVKDIIECAQSASSSSFMQCYSIIRVCDPAKKQALTEISGQSYVKDNAELFVMVADYYRHHVIEQSRQSNLAPGYETTEALIVATVDASLAAQNLVLAAESHDLGACYIGSLRNDLQQVIDILDLPLHTYPLFGIVLGYPEKIVETKPRLPMPEILHVDNYHADPALINQHLDDYDETISRYYQARQSHSKNSSWRGQMIDKMSSPTREDVDRVIKKQGFLQQ